MLAQGFRVLQREGHSRARVGELSTAHGVVQTPAFMPVGSQATVKGLSSDDLTGLGFEMVLCNAYHLYLRPGRSEEHTSELQSRLHLVCRLLLEKKKKT